MTHETIEIVDHTYAGLFLRVKEYWEAEKRALYVVDSHISSDRHTGKVYYLAIVREGVEIVRSELGADGFFSRTFKRRLK